MPVPQSAHENANRWCELRTACSEFQSMDFKAKLLVNPKNTVSLMPRQWRLTTQIIPDEVYLLISSQ